MKQDIKKIAEQIKNLVDELVERSKDGKSEGKRGIEVPKKGAIGALKMLADEGFFNAPKDISTIMEKLKEIGRYYPQTTISMNLLNLTKRRIFNRLKDKNQKIGYMY